MGCSCWQCPLCHKSASAKNLPKSYKSAPRTPKEPFVVLFRVHCTSHFAHFPWSFPRWTVFAKFARRLHGSTIFEALASPKQCIFTSYSHYFSNSFGIPLPSSLLEPFMLISWQKWRFEVPLQNPLGSKITPKPFLFCYWTRFGSSFGTSGPLFGRSWAVLWRSMAAHGFPGRFREALGSFLASYSLDFWPIGQ